MDIEVITALAEEIASLRAIRDTAPMATRIQLDSLALRLDKVLRMMSEEATRPAVRCRGMEDCPEVSYHFPSDVLTVCGLRYTMDVFRCFAAPESVGKTFRIEGNSRGHLEISQVQPPAEVVREDSADVRRFLSVLGEATRADGRMPLAAAE